jgi:hypothetical protein
MRQMTVEVRLDHGKASSFGAVRPTRPSLGAVTRSAASEFWNFVAARLPETEDEFGIRQMSVKGIGGVRRTGICSGLARLPAVVVSETSTSLLDFTS